MKSKSFYHFPFSALVRADMTLQANRHIRRQADDAVFYREVFRVDNVAFADTVFEFFAEIQQRLDRIPFARFDFHREQFCF